MRLFCREYPTYIRKFFVAFLDGVFEPGAPIRSAFRQCLSCTAKGAGPILCL